MCSCSSLKHGAFLLRENRPVAKGGLGGQGPPGLEKFTSVPPYRNEFCIYIYICIYVCVYIYVLYILAVPPLRIQAGYGPA